MYIMKNIVVFLLIIFISLFMVNFSKAAYIYEAIPFEESLAKIMNDSKVFVNSQNKQILESIDAWTIFPDLSTNIKAYNWDWTTYKYYWFFEKAKDYEVVEYDEYWVKSTYNFFNDINTINPKSIITNAQFAKFSLVASKLNVSSFAPYIWNWLSSINVNSISWNAPFVANFNWDTSLTWGGFVYEWDFWDWWRSFGKNVSYVYVLPWSYQAKLSVTDSKGDIWTSVKNMVIWWSNDCSTDTDTDTINDCLDACPLISWDIKNDWCPIFQITTPSVSNVWNECMYYNKSTVIVWNSVCSTCPCDNFTDFNADVRKCDYIVPALVSSDWKEIYSKWNYFQVVK